MSDRGPSTVDEAIFGIFDALVCVYGVIFALLSRSDGVIVHAAVGLAVASVVSMSLGEYLSDEDGSFSRVMAMGAGTLLGGVLPIIPFLVLGKRAALIVGLAISVVVCAVIGWARKKGLKGYLVTYAGMICAVLITVWVSLLIPASG